MKLNTIDGAALMSQPLRPPNLVVDSLLSQGLHILAGSPKVGKSWLALWLAVTVAKGEPVWNMHDIFLLHKCDVGECGPPEFGFLCIVVPVVDIVVHHLTEIFQLGKVKMLQDGLLERFPGATELLVENTAGMTPHLRDAQGGNELVERT